jgi:hypothetical protein
MNEATVPRSAPALGSCSLSVACRNDGSFRNAAGRFQCRRLIRGSSKGRLAIFFGTDAPSRQGDIHAPSTLEEARIWYSRKKTASSLVKSTPFHYGDELWQKQGWEIRRTPIQLRRWRQARIVVGLVLQAIQGGQAQYFANDRIRKMARVTA